MISARVFLMAALSLLVTCPPAAAADGDHSPRTPIKHFVFLFQENHTFDNYFGTRPGVDGVPPGTCMPVKAGTVTPCEKPYPIGQSGITDLGHTVAQFYREYDGGKMDGFVEANSDNGRDGSMAMGYYDDSDLPYYWNIADEYALFDRFFSSARGGSIPNHMFAVTGTPGITGKQEEIPPNGWGALPTIFDRLQAAGVSWKFYIENYDPTITFRTRDTVEKVDRAAQVIWAPVLGYKRFVDNPELSKHIVSLDEYYKDVDEGNLPAVSYIVPSGDSEHPPGRVQAGERLVQSLLVQLMRSDSWDSSAFFWTYDDWGGWYDHVRPPFIDKWGYGFRVPALLVSPYARQDFVSSRTSDFTSILAFIEHNWNLAPLAGRDAKASDLTEVFDFTKPPRAPVFLAASRTPPTLPPKVNSRPVYGAYAIAFGAAAGAAAVARRRSRRGDTQLDVLDGVS
jgi:phospholipase C